MASKIFFSHQKVYFWISAFDHRGIVVPKMHIVHWGKKKIIKAWTCDEVFLTWGLFSLSCTLVSHGASFSQVAGRVCMTLRGTIHGSGCDLRICCLKKKYKIIRRISQDKRTKAASQYAVVSGFETGFFQTIHLPESPGTTMSDPV